MFSALQGFSTVTQPSWSITANEVGAEIATWTSTATPTQTYILNRQAANAATQYRGGCYNPNNQKIYLPPYNAAGNIMVIDTVTNTISYPTFGLSGLSTAVSKYATAVFSPLNGLIYCPPYGTNSVLILDPVANTYTTQTWGFTFSGADQYYGALLGTDNKIYALGNTTGNVLIIDPIANTASQTTFGGVWASSAYGSFGGVRSTKNNKMYFAPYSRGSWFVIDTSTANATGNTTTFGVAVPAQAYQGCAQDKTGNIVSFAHNATVSTVVNPVANTRVTFATGATKTIGHGTGADGNVYGAPWNNSANWLFYNATANTMTSNNFGNATTGQWCCGSTVGNGNIYAVPDVGTANAVVRILNTNGTGNLNPPLLNTIAGSSFFNGTIV